MPSNQDQKTNPLLVPGRRLPKQQRSRETVRQILGATVEMLEVEGFSGITMQKIADRAGINVAAVYSYFPNKHQVIAEISRRQVAERDEIRRQKLQELLQMDGDWVENFVESLRDLARLRTKQRGAAVVNSALRSTPHLTGLGQEALETVADRLEEFFQQTDPGYKGDQRLRARIIAECVSATFDLIEITDKYKSDQILEEMIKMIRGYLKNP
ncbi:TetR/AcrR family transcriptional regulator [Nitratireductor sp. XY-223]|uniref:TetR/AcrR family transcriptional regulator n=1 Tax=Nitratireductor sp. XY-223 TaxID=2561926 RepID=UPI0010A9AF3E|nr:TetR/AcrR family transcriptional regulator [Nitratireductor sp. XY-223]